MATKKRRKNFVIRDEVQLESLTSPIRLEMLERLVSAGPLAASEIAARMEKSPHTIYYHLRRLVSVGLVREVGTRRTSTRPQTLYDVIAERFESSATSPEAIQFEVEAMRALLRQADRDFTAVADLDPARLGTEYSYSGRLRAHLSTSGRRTVLKHLRAIEAVFLSEREVSPGATAEVHSLTVVFLPERGGTSADE